MSLVTCHFADSDLPEASFLKPPAHLGGGEGAPVRLGQANIAGNAFGPEKAEKVSLGPMLGQVEGAALRKGWFHMEGQVLQSSCPNWGGQAKIRNNMRARGLRSRVSGADLHIRNN